MKLVKKDNQIESKQIILEYVTIIEQYVTFVYLLCMLGIFPLFYREQYYKIGEVKFKFFWNTTLCFIGISIVFILIKIIVSKTFIKNSKIEKMHNVLDSLSYMDYVVFFYGICVLLSYVFSNFKNFALKGAVGWEMGLCSQMIFIAVYFILSRQTIFLRFNFLKTDKYINNKYMEEKRIVIGILVIHLISSALVFGFGILHRFEIDPLGMYEGLELNQKIQYLSTIGQATWFSSYVCTVFGVGIMLFYLSEKLWVRVISGIYSVISFGILVTQNSDSAFIAIVGTLLLLGYFSLSDIKKYCRFWQVMSLMWGTFGGIGILQKIFAHRVVPLDSLSVFFSQSAVTWLMFAFSVMIMLFYKSFCKKAALEKEYKERIIKITKIIYKIFLTAFMIGIIAVIIFIYLNTKGYLFTWFGYQSTHSYLYFDYRWGSNRGSTWMICWQVFCGLPLHQKLFGVGPDSLAAYLYNVSEISELLQSLWRNELLTNAHNEYLNSLLCYGVVGLTSWLTVLIGGIVYFYKKSKENPFMFAFALCIMGYACHNIFCYQQVCCTPFLFIALGIGESLTKSENFNTIKEA